MPPQLHYWVFLFSLDTLACVTSFNPLGARSQGTGAGETASHRGGVGYASFELIKSVKESLPPPQTECS